jgi:opacity protein-like surface antigen
MTFFAKSLSAQSDSSMLDLIKDNVPVKNYISGAFKSSRVINNHSVEFIGKGVLDLRILHRFGFINSGANNLFGLDQARMRLGFDYGISKNLTIGIGRSTYQKEVDGMIKYRIIQQQTGAKNIPISIVWVSGIVTNTTKSADGEPAKTFSDRTGYYNELIIGRKFNENLSLQVSPAWIHRNSVISASADDKNQVFAVGAGARYKISRRVAIVADYNYILTGIDKNTFVNPLAIGVDIETGGHVFQAHFSNTIGMNEKAFITQTTNKWSDGDINFGFNISRVFTIKKSKKRL